MAQVGRLGPKVGGHLALLLHSSREPDELSQCSKHDDSTINIVMVIIIIIIIQIDAFTFTFNTALVCHHDITLSVRIVSWWYGVSVNNVTVSARFVCQ